MGLNDFIKWSEKKKELMKNIKQQHSDKEFFQALTAKDEVNIKLAYVVLLVDLAKIDHDFDSREYGVIYSRVKEIFDASHEEVEHLVQQAEKYLSSMRGSGYFVEVLKEHLSHDELKQLAVVIKEIIAADGVLDGYEQFFQEKLLSKLEL